MGTLVAPGTDPAAAPIPLAATDAIDAVIFDMDGLLLDSEPLWDEITDAFCIARGARYTEADSHACRGRGVDHTARYLSETKGFPLDVAGDVALIEAAFVGAVHRAAYCRGAEPLLAALRGRLPFALGSSSPRPIVEAALGPRGGLVLFDAIVTGSDVRHRKPAPDIFLEAARRLGIAPEKCLVLEDSVAGCRAATAAGMPSVGVHPEPSADLRRTASLVLPDLHHVTALLRLEPRPA
jgi:HAD superfamily hydrolase (TIGR01509 family)